MLRIACKDLGNEGCDFSAEADKPRKIEGKMLDHLRDEHPEMVAGITFEEHQQLEGRIKAATHEAAASA
jgi:predicted small metal-binding protein